MIKEFFFRKKRKKLFLIFKSFNILKKKNKLNLIPEIRNHIEQSLQNEMSYDKKHQVFHNFFFKDIDIKDFNNNFKNHILYETINFSFNESLLLSLNAGKINHALPLKFEKFFYKYFISFSAFNNLLWHIKLFVRIQKFFLKIICSLRFSKEQLNKNTIYIHNNEKIKKKYFELSKNLKNSNSYLWLANYSDSRSIIIPKLFQNKFQLKKKDLYLFKWNIFLFQEFHVFIIFFLKLVALYLLCNILQFTKYWKYSYMFYEISKYRSIKFKNIDNIKKFYFDNNYMFNRPLWTFSQKIPKEKVIVYFLSSNFEFIKLEDSDDIPHSGYISLDWNNYLLWDNRQKEILKKFLKRKKLDNIIFDVQSPIPNRASLDDKYEKRLDDNSLIIFDVQPYRMSRHIHLGYPNNYYTFQNIKKFYDDILEIINNKNMKIFYKRKRDSDNLDKTYLNYLNKLVKKKYLIEIDSNINVFNLFENDLKLKTISLPFTGPAYISQYYKKKTCFYDPSEKISENYNDAIKLINNKESLKNFLYD